MSKPTNHVAECERRIQAAQAALRRAQEDLEAALKSTVLTGKTAVVNVAVAPSHNSFTLYVRAVVHGVHTMTNEERAAAQSHLQLWRVHDTGALYLNFEFTPNTQMSAMPAAIDKGLNELREAGLSLNTGGSVGQTREMCVLMARLCSQIDEVLR